MDGEMMMKQLPVGTALLGPEHVCGHQIAYGDFLEMKIPLALKIPGYGIKLTNGASCEKFGKSIIDWAVIQYLDCENSHTLVKTTTGEYFYDKKQLVGLEVPATIFEALRESVLTTLRFQRASEKTDRIRDIRVKISLEKLASGSSKIYTDDSTFQYSVDPDPDIKIVTGLGYFG